MKLQQIFQDLSQTDIDTIEQSPGLLIFLPMLYIAWSDSVLTEAEVSSIEQKVLKQDWLSESEKSFVSNRLKPDHPPSPRQLKEWLSVIQRAAPHIPHDSRKSLASLGLEITRISDQTREQWQSESTQLALNQIEEALGVITTEALDDLFIEGPAKLPGVDDLVPHIDVASLAQILDGQSHRAKQELRELLQGDLFQKNSTCQIVQIIKHRYYNGCNN